MLFEHLTFLQGLIGYTAVFGGLGYGLRYLIRKGRGVRKEETEASAPTVLAPYPGEKIWTYLQRVLQEQQAATEAMTRPFYALTSCPKCKFFDVHRFEGLTRANEIEAAYPNYYERHNIPRPPGVLTGEVMRRCAKCNHSWKEV
jgi:hypothetical protein